MRLYALLVLWVFCGSDGLAADPMAAFGTTASNVFFYYEALDAATEFYSDREYDPVPGRAHHGFVAIDPEGYYLEWDIFKVSPENTDLVRAIDAE